MILKDDTETHLLAHHRDFAAFAEAMVASHPGRFDGVFWAFIERYLPARTARVVDLGTGPGLLVRDLVEHLKDAEVVGVEGQPQMLTKARALLAGVDRAKLVEADLAAPPLSGLDTASADVVIASMVVHELQVPTLILDEAARLLRPGGVFYILDWIRHPVEQYSDGERPNELAQFTHYSEHCRYTAEDYAWLVEKSGFEVVERMTRKNGRFVLLAARRLEAEVTPG